MHSYDWDNVRRKEIFKKATHEPHALVLCQGVCTSKVGKDAVIICLLGVIERLRTGDWVGWNWEWSLHTSVGVKANFASLRRVPLFAPAYLQRRRVTSSLDRFARCIEDTDWWKQVEYYQNSRLNSTLHKYQSFKETGALDLTVHLVTESVKFLDQRMH